MIAGVSWFNGQTIFSGLVQGLGHPVLIAVGIVLIYRATRVINFAVGSIGLIGTAVLSLMVLQYHLPFWFSLIVSLLVGMIFGGLVEVAVIRRLRSVPKVIVLVATVGIAQLAEAIVTVIPIPQNTTAHFPIAITNSWTIGDITVSGADLFIVIAVPVVVVALTWFLGHTQLGKTVKASAANPELARMSGINPRLISTMVWRGRRRPFGRAFDHPLGRPVRVGRQPHHARPRHLGPGAGGRGHRRNVVISPDDAGRNRHRRGPEHDPVQFLGQTGSHRFSPLDVAVC